MEYITKEIRDKAGYITYREFDDGSWRKWQYTEEHLINSFETSDGYSVIVKRNGKYAVYAKKSHKDTVIETFRNTNSDETEFLTTVKKNGRSYRRFIKRYKKFDNDKNKLIYEKTYYDTNTEWYKRDNEGRLIEYTNRDLLWHRNYFDEVGNLVYSEYSSGSYTKYEYDEERKLCISLEEYNYKKGNLIIVKNNYGIKNIVYDC